MPYIFPYEDVFVWGIGLLIIALLCLRVWIARRQRYEGKDRKAFHDSTPND